MIQNRVAPKISVLVAIHNVEKYLTQCLDSLRSQTNKNSEFILVDDGSTDKSGIICDQYSLIDKRFKVIHQKNSGTLFSRKIAIQKATGDWAIFVDGDDFLPKKETLLELQQLVEKNDADIINFNIDCIGENPKEVNSFRSWFYKGALPPKSIDTPQTLLDLIFIQQKIKWHMWNKIYKVDLLKKTLPHIPNDNISSSIDVFLTFLFAYFSTSFVIKNTEPYYTYRVGTGVSTGEKTYEKFKRIANGYKCTIRIEEFSNAQEAYQLKEVVDSIKRFTAKFIVRSFSCLSIRDQKKGLYLLLSCRIPESILLENLAFFYKGNYSILSDILYDCFLASFVQNGSKLDRFDSKREFFSDKEYLVFLKRKFLKSKCKYLLYSFLSRLFLGSSKQRLIAKKVKHKNKSKCLRRKIEVIAGQLYENSSKFPKNL